MTTSRKSRFVSFKIREQLSIKKIMTINRILTPMQIPQNFTVAENKDILGLKKKDHTFQRNCSIFFAAGGRDYRQIHEYTSLAELIRKFLQSDMLVDFSRRQEIRSFGDSTLGGEERNRLCFRLSAAKSFAQSSVV